MNPESRRSNRKSTSYKGKVASYQTRCRELEQQKRELENTEIVAVVRSMDVSPDELAEVLRALRSGAPLPQNHLNKEDKQPCELNSVPWQSH